MLKGKSEPVRVFHAKTPRARLGTDLTRTHDTPFIGREIDLAILKGVFEKTVAAESPQLVTVVGEPGLGKSRIVAELGRYVEDRPELVTWRQGRCLPYGEGITFWALGEILKAHAGILESDPPEVATAKLEAVLPEGAERAMVPPAAPPVARDRGDVHRRTRGAVHRVAAVPRAHRRAGSRPCSCSRTCIGPTRRCSRSSSTSPIGPKACRCSWSARPVPSCSNATPTTPTGLRNITTINLAPLSEEETARLVSALLETTVIPAELQQPILDRAGGNPLYAEEFVRLLKDKDLLVKKGSSWELREGAEVPFPDSVQALIAARLDTLSAGREVDARRRRRHRQGLLGRCDRADGRTRPR